MSIIATKGVTERLQAALDKQAKIADPEKCRVILREAINKEIATINAIKEMHGFRAWLEGERIDLTKVRGRK